MPTTTQSDLAGFARGWFVISFSDELAPGQVKPLHYFGQDLVLFRTERGEPKVLDAFCPHLGAHLGHGGKVEGEAIKCPFHAWKFNGAGECTEVPYAKKIPPKAKLDCWPVCERNQMIFVYHDPEKQPPDYEIPIIAECDDDGWTNWDHSMLTVKTHPQAIAENVADRAHFIPVHGTHIDEFDNVYDGHIARQINNGVAYPLGGGEDRFQLTATYYGPGYQVSEMQGFLASKLVNAHTPVDDTTVDLRFGVMIQKQSSQKKTEAFSAGYVNNLREGFLQDVRIWEHKTFRDKPILADGDGPIMKLRKWYAQFYEPRGSVNR